MKKYKYTNKDEKPVPRFSKGQIVWFYEKYSSMSPTTTEIRDVLIMWREYDKLDPYPQMSEDEKEEWYAKRVPHWEIEYCHKPRNNRRAARFTINEDELYETEIEATVVFYKEYIEKVKNNLEGFERKFKRLDIEMPSLKLLPSKEK